ncbi:hypothetical protein [Mycolicibacterium sp. XJ652]
MTLETLWSIHGLSEHVDFSQSTEFVARRGGRGFKFSFFYGPMWLFLLAGLGGWYYQYRKGNPEKAKRIEQRLRGTSASTVQRLKSAMDDKNRSSATTQQPYGGHRPLDPGNVHGTMRFNPPPNWPIPPSGWTPDEDWQPDPSWPPAPPGWQFWVA